MGNKGSADTDLLACRGIFASVGEKFGKDALQIAQVGMQRGQVGSDRQV